MGAKHGKAKTKQQSKITSRDNVTRTPQSSHREETTRSNSTQCKQDMVPSTAMQARLERKFSISSCSGSCRRKTVKGRGPLLTQSENSANGQVPHALLNRTLSLQSGESRPEAAVNAGRVRKNYKRHDLTCPVPAYSTFGRIRGKTLILNNINFQDDPLGDYTRRGADVDEGKLMDLFQQLGLNPAAKQDKTGEQMIKAMTRFASGLRDVDMSVVVIMSHGEGGTDKVTEILGVDRERVRISSILEIFSAQHCRAMKSKPKIFIFQCCRGYFEPMDQHDAVPFKPVIYEDVLLAFATSPGYVAYRNPESGSYYIQALCEVFSEYAQDLDVADLLVKVQATLEKIAGRKQFCSSENYSFKKCYLHPM